MPYSEKSDKKGESSVERNTSTKIQLRPSVEAILITEQGAQLGEEGVELVQCCGALHDVLHGERTVRYEGSNR